MGSARYIASVVTESVFPLSVLQRERVSKYDQTVYPLVNDEVMFHCKRLEADGTMKGSLSGMRPDMVSQAEFSLSIDIQSGQI